jgi:hypothetical protein
MLAYIRGTTTKTGFRVSAHLDENIYQRGQKVSKGEVAGLSLRQYEVCPKWNYVISPE